MKYIPFLFFVFSVAFSQDKIQRYKIIEVEHFSAGTRNTENVSVIATAGDKKSIILLDTYTGRSWYLSPVLYPIDSSRYQERYQWMPLDFFQYDADHLDQSLPPPINNLSGAKKNISK